MLKFLLDTNAVIALLSPQPQILQTRIQQYSSHEIGISTVVMFELFFGAYRSQRVQRNLTILETIPLPIIAFDQQDAMAAGEIRATLAAAGTPIGPYDVLIAGQALARGLCLITANTREFSRIHHLQLDNWQMP